MIAFTVRSTPYVSILISCYVISCSSNNSRPPRDLKGENMLKRLGYVTASCHMQQGAAWNVLLDVQCSVRRFSNMTVSSKRPGHILKYQVRSIVLNSPYEVRSTRSGNTLEKNKV